MRGIILTGVAGLVLVSCDDPTVPVLNDIADIESDIAEWTDKLEGIEDDLAKAKSEMRDVEGQCESANRDVRDRISSLERDVSSSLQRASSNNGDYFNRWRIQVREFSKNSWELAVTDQEFYKTRRDRYSTESTSEYTIKLNPTRLKTKAEVTTWRGAPTVRLVCQGESQCISRSGRYERLTYNFTRQTERDRGNVPASGPDMRWAFNSDQAMNKVRQDVSTLLAAYGEEEHESCGKVDELETEVERIEAELETPKKELNDLNEDLSDKKAELRKLQ